MSKQPNYVFVLDTNRKPLTPMNKNELTASIEAFLAKLSVGLRSKAFQYAENQGIRDEFASFRYQLSYLLNEIHPSLRTECAALIEQYESFLKEKIAS